MHLGIHPSGDPQRAGSVERETPELATLPQEIVPGTAVETLRAQHGEPRPTPTMAHARDSLAGEAAISLRLPLEA